MDDAELVDLALSGDPDAFAALYDTFADSLHDFCASMLRDWDEAADASEQTFLAAFESLEELANPDRLLPWLYAIAHRVVSDRVPDGALAPDAGDEDLIFGPESGDETMSREQLTTFVWQATAGLDLEERILVDLDLRQGLRGRDLASAAGVPPGEVDRQADRVEAEWERSIGALLVARLGRQDCPDLEDMLDRWSGRLTPAFRAQVTAHVDGCQACDPLRQSLPDPLARLESIPLIPAPAELRDPVLDAGDAEADVRRGDAAVGPPVATRGWSFDQDGFPVLAVAPARAPREAAVGAGGRPAGAPTASPTGWAAGGHTDLADTALWAPAPTGPVGTPRPSRGPTGPVGTPRPSRGPTGPGGVGGRRGPPEGTGFGFDGEAHPAAPERDRRGAVVGTLAGIIVLILAALFVSKQRGGGSSITLETTTLPSLATVNNSSPTSTIAPLSVPVSGATTTTVVTSGQLVVTTTGASQTLDFGVSATTESFTVSNSGQDSVTFTAAATGPGLSVQPSTGMLIPGASQILTATLSRTAAAQGTYTGSIALTSPNPTGTKTVTTTVTVTGTIDSGPSISANHANPITIYVSSCARLPKGGKTSAQVTATVSGPVPMTEVVLHWQLAGGGTAGTSIMSGVGSSYAGELGPFDSAGNVGWYITAIDSASATATSQSQALSVSSC